MILVGVIQSTEGLSGTKRQRKDKFALSACAEHLHPISDICASGTQAFELSE